MEEGERIAFRFFPARGAKSDDGATRNARHVFALPRVIIGDF